MTATPRSQDRAERRLGGPGRHPEGDGVGLDRRAVVAPSARRSPGRGADTGSRRRHRRPPPARPAPAPRTSRDERRDPVRSRGGPGPSAGRSSRRRPGSFDAATPYRRYIDARRSGSRGPRRSPPPIGRRGARCRLELVQPLEGRAHVVEGRSVTRARPRRRSDAPIGRGEQRHRRRAVGLGTDPPAPVSSHRPDPRAPLESGRRPGRRRPPAARRTCLCPRRYSSAAMRRGYAAARARVRPVTMRACRSTSSAAPPPLPARSSCSSPTAPRSSSTAGCSRAAPTRSIRNRVPFAFDPSELDAVLLTHAHLDHCGLLPVAGPRRLSPARSTLTAGTVELAEIVLLDSGQLHEEFAKRDARWEKRHPRGGRRGRPEAADAVPGRRRPRRGR